MRKMSAADKVLTFFGVIVGPPIILALLSFLVFLYKERQGCASEVRFVPATESRAPNAANPRDRGEKGLAEHYSYHNQNFKTKGDAITACVRNTS